MPGKKGCAAGCKLTLKELNDEWKHNPKSYYKIINGRAIRNSELRKEVDKFDAEISYKYTPKKDKQGSGL